MLAAPHTAGLRRASARHRLAYGRAAGPLFINTRARRALPRQASCHDAQQMRPADGP